MRCLLFVVLVLLLRAQAGTCQTALACVPFQGSPASAHRCDPFLDGRHVLLAGKSYEEVDEAAGKLAAPFGAMVPYKCRTAALQLICQGSFPVCVIGSSLALMPPCRSVCEMMTLECVAFLASANLTRAMPDCDMTQTINGVPYPAFPPDGLSCLSYAPTTEVAYSQADCPYPLEFDPARLSLENPQEACVLGCPSYLFGGEAEYWGAAAAMYFTAVPSMVCSLVMIFTWLLNPSKRRYPAILLLWLAVAVFMMDLFVNMSVLVGGPLRTSCTWGEVRVQVTMDNASENTGQGVVCIMQAIGTYYFGLANIFWWFAVTINIFLMVCCHKYDWVHRYNRYIHCAFHVGCWGLPLVGLIALLSWKKLGGNAIHPFCGLIYDRDNSWVDWIFYSAPIVFCIVVGTLLMVISITRLIYVQTKERTRLTELNHLTRLILLVAFLWLNNVFFISYRAYVETIWDQLYDSLAAQVACSLLTGTECEMDGALSFPFYIVSLVASLSTGVCLFLTMCTTKSTLVLLLRLLRGLRHPRTFVAHTRLVISMQGASSSAVSSAGSSHDMFKASGTEMSALSASEPSSS